MEKSDHGKEEIENIEELKNLMEEAERLDLTDKPDGTEEPISEEAEESFGKRAGTDRKKLLRIGTVCLQLVLVIGIVGVCFLIGKNVIDHAMLKETKSTTRNIISESSSAQTEQLPEEEEQETSEEENGYQGAYHIDINLKKYAAVIYGYQEDGTEFPIKVMNCTVGPDIKAGDYTIAQAFPWAQDTDGNWHMYNCSFGSRLWIQSVGYEKRTHDSLLTDEYNLITKKNADGNGVRLSVGDAYWIYKNCPEGTKLTVSKDGDLPLERAEFEKIDSIYGWDPTDPYKHNPWLHAGKNKISATTATVQVERGEEIPYLANVVAFDAKGKSLTKKLEYEEIDTKQVGKYKVEYTYGTGEKQLKASVTYEIKDTTPPVIRLKPDGKNEFTVKVAHSNFTEQYLNGEKLINQIVKQIKKNLEVLDLEEPIELNSGNYTITLPEKFYADRNMVVIEATDAYENTGKQAVYVFIEEKEDAETTVKETTTQKPKETVTQKPKETTTQKPKETTTKKPKETTTQKPKETTTKKNTATTPPKVTTPSGTTSPELDPPYAEPDSDSEDQIPEPEGQVSAENS